MLTFVGIFMITYLKFPKDLGDRALNIFCNCLRPTCRPRSIQGWVSWSRG